MNKHIFLNKKNGIFIEIGAYDGIKYSNTKFYEDTLNWKGILIEPIPEYYNQLSTNRPNSICVEGCISNKSGVTKFNRIKSKDYFVMMLSGITSNYEQKHLVRAKREMEESGGSLEVLEVNCYLLYVPVDKSFPKYVQENYNMLLEKNLIGRISE